MANTTTFATQHTHDMSVNMFTLFLDWCGGQEKNRIMWTGLALALHGCVFTPLTMMAVMLSGIPMLLMVITIVGIFTNLVVNLAAMSTRVTVPVFFLSILADIGVIIAAAYIGLDFGRIF